MKNLSGLPRTANAGVVESFSGLRCRIYVYPSANEQSLIYNLKFVIFPTTPSLRATPPLEGGEFLLTYIYNAKFLYSIAGNNIHTAGKKYLRDTKKYLHSANVFHAGANVFLHGAKKYHVGANVFWDGTNVFRLAGNLF